MLAGVLDRDGQQLSASQTWQHALANADHLAILNAIWTDQTTPARERHYRDLLLAHLPPEHRREPGHQARWLWRTLRAAELAGLDTAQVLAAAIAERDLAGARDLAAVIDARLRYRIGALVPAPAGPWSAQVPALADPERRAWLTEIAAMMDARKDRIGEHAAEHTPPWAVNALGPVPDHPLNRLDWQRWATSIGAYRELSGHSDPADPIGPEPATAAPTSAPPGTRPWPPSAPPTGPTSAACPTAGCCTCATPTRSRPPGPRNTSATNSARSAPRPATPAWPASRAAAEADAAQRHGHHDHDHDHASSQRELATSYQAMHDAYRERETVFAAVMADRADWDTATRAQRHLAVAADGELRRRHPGQHYPPLRSAEPDPATPAQRDELTLTTGEQIREMSQWFTDLAAQRRAFADRLADRQSVTIPAADPDYEDLGPAFPAWTASRTGAILQPPKPEIRPSTLVLERAADHDADWEAAD